MKSALVLWIGFALIAADLLVTKQGQNLWNLFTQPAVPKQPTTTSSTTSQAQQVWDTALNILNTKALTDPVQQAIAAGNTALSGAPNRPGAR